jgi:hypothetical protein
MAEKLLVNDFVVNFGVLAADADEIVSPVVAMAATTARLPILLSFRMCILPTPTFFRAAIRLVVLAAALHRDCVLDPNQSDDKSVTVF